MQKSIFVAGLDYSINNNELNTIFAKYGNVISAKVITDKLIGKSKGFGFVDMNEASDAQRCITTLHNTLYKSRNLIVQEKEDRPPSFTPRHDKRGNNYE